MKTRLKYLRFVLSLTGLYRACVLLSAIILCLDANAQEGVSGLQNEHDPDFPRRRQFNAGVFATYTSITPPPAVIGDVTYGVTKRLSVGVLAGTTGAQSLAGLKLNARLMERNAFSVVYRMVIIYYPGRDGTYLFDKSDKFIMPWILSMGVVDATYRMKSGIRWSAGVGLLETHCIEGMKQYLWGHSEDDKVMPIELFHTLQASISVPLSERLTFRGEVFTVMRDAKLIRTGEFKVFPINPFLKVVYSF